MKKYCHCVLKSTYSTDKYFEYCKIDNMEDIDLSIIESTTWKKTIRKKNVCLYECGKVMYFNSQILDKIR